MKFVTTLFFFIGFSCMAQANRQVVFTDSLTASKFYFPLNTKLTDISYVSFKKCVAVLQKSDICLYSMKNPEGEQYSWTRINEFDKNERYGSLIRTEKIGNMLDGWYRYYQNKTKTGKGYITCVTLIRGNVYAVYLVESAYKEEDLKSKEVVAASVFSKVKKNNRRKEPKGSEWFVIGAINLVALCFWKLRSKLNDCLKIILISVSGAVLFVYLVYIAWLEVWPFSIGSVLFNVVFWSACLYAKSWDDFWNRLEQVFSNMKE